MPVLAGISCTSPGTLRVQLRTELSRHAMTSQEYVSWKSSFVLHGTFGRTEMISFSEIKVLL
jgi:hypothetical protein